MVSHPITFAIEESLVVPERPPKTRAFSLYEPGKSYAYDTQEEYYQGYRESYYALTTLKSGWDCMRHYEILANGCIPYFPRLHQCPSGTMVNFPKELILEAMNLPGVNFDRREIDYTVFPLKRYNEIVEELLSYTRLHLTTKAMALRLLRLSGGSTSSKVLMLCGSDYPDYQRCLLAQGLRQVLGDKFIELPKLHHLYDDFNVPPGFSGRGFTFTKHLNSSLEINRFNLPDRIESKEFDLIIYGSLHRGRPFWELVNKSYPPEKVILVCGEDLHQCHDLHDPNRRQPIFVREYGNA